MTSRITDKEDIKSKNIKIIGLIVIILGIVLVISGIATISIGMTLGPNMGMGFDEFAAAMQLSSNTTLMGMGILSGGMFILIFGLCFIFYGGVAGINEKFVSRIRNKDYRDVNPYLKGSPSKEKLKCPYCKTKIQVGLRICPECGTEL